MLGHTAILFCALACTSGYIIGRISYVQFEITNKRPSQGTCTHTTPEAQHLPITDVSSTENEVEELRMEMNGYRHLANHNYYKLVKEPGTDWANARRNCKADGGDLAVIDSEEEADFLLNLFRMDPSRVDEYVYEGFVGATDEETEGTFVTVDGELLSNMEFDTWLPNEPNNGDGKRSQEENCVSFHKGRGYNDIDCGRSMPYFCKIKKNDFNIQL